MPAPTTADDFLSVVAKSKLVTDDTLANYRRQSADSPARLAERMVQDGRLTKFQAEILLTGKCRPFFVGPYKVLSRIGNGSMGVVYLCEHMDMRRRVALKVLQNRRVRDEASRQRFLREARAAAALNHPNVVHAVDLAQEGDLHYLVMEYIDGMSLKRLVQTEGPIRAAPAADYLRQAAMGLEHAHAAGLVHRDIKPSNIMVDRSGVVKILDLGLARFDEEEIDLTQGAVLGTAGYLAPEQALDSHTVDARADIYSLGATFFLALTGRQPLVIAEGPVKPPYPDEVKLFHRLMGVIRRMMAAEPQNRYQRAMEVALAVATWGTAPHVALPAIRPGPTAEPIAASTADDVAFDTPPPTAVPTPVDLRTVPSVPARPPVRPPASTPAPARVLTQPVAKQPVVKPTAPVAGRAWSRFSRVPLWQWVTAGTIAVVVGLLLAFATHSKKPAPAAKNAPPQTAPAR